MLQDGVLNVGVYVVDTKYQVHTVAIPISLTLTLVPIEMQVLLQNPKICTELLSIFHSVDVGLSFSEKTIIYGLAG